LVGNPEGKRPLGGPRRRWVDNTKMGLKEIWWDGMDLIDLVQYRDQGRVLVNTVMNFRVPWNAVKYLSSCTIGGFSRRIQFHEWVRENEAYVLQNYCVSRNYLSFWFIYFK
jgi:hypothetical protein